MRIRRCFTNPICFLYKIKIPLSHPKAIGRKLSYYPDPVRHALMDPASAVIGITSFTFTVCGKINALRKEIKGAPGQVQALQELCGVIELFVDRLRSIGTPDASYSPGEAAYLNVLCDKSQHCLEEVDKAVEAVVVRIRGGGQPAIRWNKWIMKKGDLQEMSQTLMNLRDSLSMMVDFMHL
ncbi:hypothetical protein BDY19DRAFT_996627 [Irpex rosettiformis]|uniref:Uncharacterized protein n=1 Tax=Irpex rosettiformis TaxID=378272 RepID=A0ACB8TTY1_9APHY|nr:hypothetical protein BDY19DRAFT_996627 [Irpex rosettiformis]